MSDVTTGIQQAITFLENPVHRHRDLLRKSAVSSVEALQCMHRVQKSGNARMGNRIVQDIDAEPSSGRMPRNGEDAAHCLDRRRRLMTDPTQADPSRSKEGGVL